VEASRPKAAVATTSSNTVPLRKAKFSRPRTPSPVVSPLRDFEGPVRGLLPTPAWKTRQQEETGDDSEKFKTSSEDGEETDEINLSAFEEAAVSLGVETYRLLS